MCVYLYIFVGAIELFLMLLEYDFFNEMVCASFFEKYLTDVL